MATQGLVTVRKCGRVVMKIVVGREGSNAYKVAHIIRQMKRVPKMKEARNIAKNVFFGSVYDRVVVTKANIHMCVGDMELYRTTFDDARFNPRWACGIVDFMEIVDL